METLKKYLETPEEERDYQQGVELYNKYGDNARLKHVTFPIGNIPNIRNTLMYELQKILQQRFGQVAIVAEKAKEKVEEKPVFIPVTEAGPTGYLKKEFPTLDFDTLPDELKILVVDRISLYNKAKAARERLFDNSLSEQELYEANRDNIEFRLQNEEIWKELNAFATSGKPIGNHPIFIQKRERERLQSLDRTSLYKIVNNAASYYTKQNNLIAETEDPERIFMLKKKIKFREWQVKEACGLLGINVK